MDWMNPKGKKRETHKELANRDELVERISRAICKDGTVEPPPIRDMGRLRESAGQSYE